MKSIPLPLRLAAGLAVSAAERARELPRQLTGLPITVASQLLQFSMRVQQQVTELAIKGDEALSGLYPVEETPSWATFDEDVPFEDDSFGTASAYGSPFDRVDEPSEPDFAMPEPRFSSNGYGYHADALADTGAAEQALAEDPWTAEQDALASELGPDGDEPPTDATSPDGAGSRRPPEWLPNYDELSLPQLRARLRTFSAEQLAELLDYERLSADRDEFTGMLARRIDTVRKKENERSGPDQTS